MTHPGIGQGLVIACGPSGYAGAGRIMISWLRQLRDLGWRVACVTPTRPAAFRTVEAHHIEWHPPVPVWSAAMENGGAAGSPDTLSIGGYAERIIQVALKSRPNRLVLWGHYLFPYGSSVLCAAAALRRSAVKPVVWMTPTGSDVWEIAAQIPAVARATVSDPMVDRVITYSARFAREIRELAPEMVGVNLLPPVLEDRYRYVMAPCRQAARRSFGLDPQALVMSTHSNMRPVKRPQDVLRLVRMVAEESARPAVLIAAGPAGRLAGRSGPQLSVLETGITDEIPRILAASDLELNCSAHDSFNLSLAEAVACGTPVATTDVVGFAETIDELGCGLTFGVDGGDGVNQRPAAAGIARSIAGGRWSRDVMYAASVSVRHMLGSTAVRSSLAHLLPST
jgi:glycosyltransferase involved in cell wall biosynthesis